MLEALVRGQHRRGAPVPDIDQLEEQPRPVRCDREVADLVHAQLRYLLSNARTIDQELALALEHRSAEPSRRGSPGAPPSSDRHCAVRRPSSRSACLTQFRIVCCEGSNSRARDPGLRPALGAQYGQLSGDTNPSPRITRNPELLVDIPQMWVSDPSSNRNIEGTRTRRGVDSLSPRRIEYQTDNPLSISGVWSHTSPAELATTRVTAGKWLGTWTILSTMLRSSSSVNPPYSRAVWKRGDVRRQVL